MYLTEQLEKKWAPVLDHAGAGQIKDSYRRAVTAMVLENQEKAMAEEGRMLNESPLNGAGTGGFGGTASSPVAGYDPILISLVRRALPNLIAYDIAGVQPMSGPTGLIFAMRATKTNRTTETFFNEVDCRFAFATVGLLLGKFPKRVQFDLCHDQTPFLAVYFNRQGKYFWEN